MTLFIYLVGTLVVAAVLYAALRVPVQRYFRTRGDRVVNCPDNGEPVAVRVDALHAAVTPADASDRFRIESCSRWPQKDGCGQMCLAQIEAQPTDCLVRSQVDLWYAGKTCALCGKGLDGLDWTRHKPALQSPDGVTMEWSAVKPESLWAVMGSHRPVCWDCHIAETFRRQRPDLVLDNPQRY